MGTVSGMATLSRIARLLPRLARDVTAGSARAGRRDDRAAAGADQPSAGPGYPGDFDGLPAPLTGPTASGVAVGEVVWTWVPYEEDHTKGKDRPVLVVGEDGSWLLALPLTSTDHDLDEDQERRAGRHWIDVGSGAWDRKGRRSEARLDRVIRVDPDGLRRDGGALAPAVLSAVLEAMHAVAEGRGYDDDPV